MTNGKIEKAIAILSTASGLHSIEDKDNEEVA